MEKLNIPEIFGSMVFGEEEMRARLPEDVCASLLSTIEEGKEIDPGIADSVAEAMKNK